MPETRFTRAGDVDIAYQVVGPQAGLDVVFIPGWVSHLEVMWELPGAVLGERASLEQGRRTATIRAVTDCRVVSYLAADLSPDDLRELATGHRREDQQP